MYRSAHKHRIYCSDSKQVLDQNDSVGSGTYGESPNFKKIQNFDSKELNIKNMKLWNLKWKSLWNLHFQTFSKKIEEFSNKHFCQLVENFRNLCFWEFGCQKIRKDYSVRGPR